MKAFRTNPRRDASPTIRGFVYQVDLTIQRWLDLTSDSILELERGEDVDTIQNAMLSRGTKQHRLLEQIKARERSVTLRSPSALEALASFCEHEADNPHLNLRYAYITNAKIGSERRLAIQDKIPLVDLWNRLSRESVTKTEHKRQLKILRDFLLDATKPRDLNLRTWTAFRRLLNRRSLAEFHSFVRRVEWLTNQTPTDVVASQIQSTLITKYSIASEQTQTLYSVLFLHVFKVLSQKGIKQLTVPQRDSLLATPSLSAADRIQLSQISKYLTDLTARVNILEQDVSLLKSRPLPTRAELREACHSATQRIANGIVEDRSLISRRDLTEKLNAFLSSRARYFFVLGRSGVGKSISFATEALELSKKETIVYLSTGKSFSLVDAAKTIADELARPYPNLSWQNVLTALTANSVLDHSPFIIFIDAIDEADDVDQIAKELTKLHQSIAATPVEQVKVIISCRDLAWNRFRQQRLTPLYETRHVAGSGRAAVEVELDDFTTRELDDALRAIGATELLNVGRFGDSPSPHVSAVREILRHPATFEHYAVLKQSDATLPMQEITWSYLIEKRLKAGLERCARQSGVSASVWESSLVTLAKLAWKAKSFDFGSDVIDEAILPLNESTTNDRLSPLESLVENRILDESVTANERKFSFPISDIGAYLLSKELERQVSVSHPTKLRSQFEEWLKETWNFHPLLDAILALADRFFEEPYGSRSTAMVEAIVESHRFHDGSIFELMRPHVLKTIFEIVAHRDDIHFYDYREAALKVRLFEGTLEEIRSHLEDDNPFTRRLAAELAGAHQDKESITRLIQFLRDKDHGVRERAYKAIGLIGTPAISPLLKTILGTSVSVNLKNSCLHALRNIGQRNYEISEVLATTLTAAKHNEPLLRSAFLTAAFVRDRGHAKIAGASLNHDWKIAQAAAKYLAEVPDASVYPSLKKALCPSNGNEDHSRNLSQLIVALLRTDRVKARQDLRELYKEALSDGHELTVNQAIHLSEKLDIPDLQPLILSRLIEQLHLGSQGKVIWESARVLGTTWRTDELEALVRATQKFEKRGVDLAKLFVEAIIPGIGESEEFRLGDRLNRTSDLIPVVKCQSEHFVLEAARLLRHSGFLSCMDLCRWLWIVGDNKVEAALIRRFENPSEKREAIHERSYAVRALGTCGEDKTEKLVLDYLRTKGEEVDLRFPQETLYPLLIRKVIYPKDLIAIAKNPKLNWWSRSACLIALSLVDKSGWTDLYAAEASSSSNAPRLQAQAARSLMITSKLSIIPKLRNLLRNSENSAVKEEAAEGLAQLNDISSIHEIERALERLDRPGLASALSLFRAESSLPILLRRLASANYETRSGYLRALSAFWNYPDGRAAILDQFDKWSSYEERYFNNQSALIAGLCLYEPNVILDQFNKSFDDGHITPNAREEMALWLWRLFNRKTADNKILLETAKRLVCDKHVPARDKAVHTLRYADKSFSKELFQQLYSSSSSSDWERAAAAYSLAFWDCPPRLIRTARFDNSWLVRRAGDAAFSNREKRKHLNKHLLTFESGTGQRRLSAYLCLMEQGDQTTIWEMHDDGHMTGIAQTFRDQLTGAIRRRLTSEHKKKQDEENKLDESRGEIWFD